MPTPYLASGAITIQNSNVSTGAPTAGSYVQLTNLDQSAQTLGFNVSGTYTGALTVRGTADGNTWYALSAEQVINTATLLASATIASGVTGEFLVNTAGLLGVRVNAEASVTGTATVSLFQSLSSTPVAVNPQTTGSLTATQAPSASVAVIKAAPGFLCRVLVNVTGSNPALIYDNASAASGTIIGALPASPTVGTIYTFNAPALNGITLSASSSNPNLTFFYD